MKKQILIGVTLLVGLLVQGCASSPTQEIIVPAPALSEVFRGGTIKGLENNEGQYLGHPGSYDLVQHTCTSTPIFDMYGRYLRTSVRCD